MAVDVHEADRAIPPTEEIPNMVDEATAPHALPSNSDNHLALDHGNRTVVTTGPFAGSSGILVQRRGTGRCLIRVDEPESGLLIEVDEEVIRLVR